LTNAVARTAISKYADVVSVKDFGAKGDGVRVTGAASITSGSAALNVTGAAFTSADAGKLIMVPGAGVAGGWLKTTIATRVSATQVTLSATAGTTLSAVSKTVYYGTDDTNVIQNAHTAAWLAGKALFFPDGDYAHSSALFFGNAGAVISNSGRAGLTFTGGGAGISIDAGALNTDNLYNVSFGSRHSPINLRGNPSATNLVFARGVHHSHIHVNAKDGTYGLNLNFAVCSDFSVSCTSNSGAFLSTPAAGLVAGIRNAGEYVTDCQFYLIIEGVSSTGVQLAGVHGCTFRGTSEGNDGGVYEGANCDRNVWKAFHCEANSSYDWTLDGSNQTILNNCAGASTAGLVLSGVTRARFNGGVFSNLSATGGSGVHFESVNVLNTAGFASAPATFTWRKVYDGSGVYIADRIGRPTLNTPTLSGTWVDYGSGYRAARYWQSEDGIVSLTGAVKSGASGSAICTLPAGMRPIGTVVFSYVDFTGPTTGWLQVASTGVVSHVSGTTAFVSLDNVKFLAEQ
jgi:hypothetical protein